MKHLFRLAAVTIISALTLQAQASGWTVPLSPPTSPGIAVGSQATILRTSSGGLTSVTGHRPSVPITIQLDQNYPNPFNPSTRITYRLSSPAEISLKVYNLIGQEIATLDAGLRSAGVHDVKFDAGNLASGIYLYRFQSGGFVETRRMTVMK